MENKFTDDTFLARWLAGQLTEEELAEFKQREDYAIYEKIAQTPIDLETPARDKNAGWERLQSQMGGTQRTAPPTKVRRLRRSWLYAAATVLLLTVAGYWLLQQPATSLQTFATPIALQKTVQLPDGSEVRLNAASSLWLDRATFAEKRTVHLEGEAFFSVEEGSAFTVVTTNGAVRVLGTTFNVFARTQKLEVACFSGKVGVSFDDFREMEVLQPGEKLKSQSQKILRKQTLSNDQQTPNWMRGESRFEQVRLLEVIAELERQYQISIDYPKELAAIDGYTGGFPHGDLETALQIVFSSVDYQYRISDKEVEVFR